MKFRGTGTLAMQWMNVKGNVTQLQQQVTGDLTDIEDGRVQDVQRMKLKGNPKRTFTGHSMRTCKEIYSKHRSLQ